MVTVNMKMLGALSAITVGSVMGQSCVQLSATALSSSCPCEDTTLTFTLEGETTVEANTINLAVVLDGSGSINEGEFLLEQEFAMDIVASFAARNLFENGGTASYVQFAGVLVSSGTFASAEDFNNFAAADVQAGKGTVTSAGINEATALLGANPATTSFMIVITDGESNVFSTTVASADAARAEGIIVYAVGIGLGRDVELVAIGGDPANVFQVDEFAVLDAVLDGIFSRSGGSVIPCPSTGAMMSIEFSVPVDSTASGSVSGSTVTFSAADLEDNASDFEVLLEVCSTAPGDSIVVSVDYTDDQGNTPDLSLLTSLVVGDDFCTSPTPLITPVPTPSPTKMLQVPTPHPTTMSQVPTPYPTTMSQVPTPHPTKISQVPTPHPTKIIQIPTPHPTTLTPEPTPCPEKTTPEPTPTPTQMSQVPTPHPSKISQVPTPHPITMSQRPTPHPTKLSQVPTPHPTKISQEPTPHPTIVAQVPTPHPTKMSQVPTPQPTKMSQVPTPHPTKMSDVPTPHPTQLSPEATLCPNDTNKTPPRLGEHLKCGWVEHFEYLGCYVDEAQNRSLKGPMSSSHIMTAQMCEETCTSSGFEYFGMSYSSDCHCGCAQPTGEEGVCNYECSGDNSTACGGVGTMSIYKSDY